VIAVSVLIAALSAPRAENAKTAEQFGIEYQPLDMQLPPRTRPADWLEYSPWLNVAIALLLGWYLIDVFRHSPQGALAALDLNHYKRIFITAGLLLQCRPRRFLKAVAEAIPSTGGVLIQF